MTRPKTIFLSNNDVANTLDMTSAIDALYHMLQDSANGSAFNIPKALGRWGDGCTMHSLSSAMTQRGYAGIKNWMHTPRGGGSIFSLFDAHNGYLLALIEARTLGQLRTGGITGVATKLMAPRTARRAALIGTGAQAVTQLKAIAAVQALDAVHVYSPSAEKRRAFVQANNHFPFQLIEAGSLDAALDGAEIVTLITRAKDPFVHVDQLKECVHLNAVGAILPDKAEFTLDVFDRCDLIAVDDIENARRGSRELREKFGEDSTQWNVTTLASLTAGPAYETPPGRMSLFKGMGMGLSDLALAIALYEYARESGLGLTLPN